MKFSLLFWILSALMIAIGAMMRLVGESRDDSDQAAPIPRITAKLVQQYAYAGGTDTEIADRFLVDVKFLRQRFSAVLKVSRAMRKLSLRGYQTDLAKKVNGPMLIWLGRNELGQALNSAHFGGDEPEYEVE